MHTRSCRLNLSRNFASFEEGLVAARFQVTQATVAQGGAGTGSVAFVVLTVTLTGAEAKIVLMRFAAEPLFLLETKPCRPVKFASFLRTGRRETFGNVVFARRPRRVVRRLVALDAAVALAAAGGWVAFVVATAGAAPVAAAAVLLGVLAAASLDDVAPAAASQESSSMRAICSILRRR